MTDWRPMSELERRAALAATPGRVTYPVGSPPKRLARNLAAQATAAEPRITERQALALWSLVWRFRRQIADVDLIAHAQSYAIPKTLLLQ